MVLLTIAGSTIPAAARAAAVDVPLATALFTHIGFDTIKRTDYATVGDALVATVDQSSSFLFKGFPKAVSVERVAFSWRLEGELHVPDAALEETVDGDDAILRIGLLLAGPEPLFPWFAPAWVKAVRAALTLPADRMVYLIPHARHSVGARWPSPYSASIECLSVGATATADGWNQSAFASATALPVVGLWLMADGDNTKSTFRTWLQHLRLESGAR